jgi:predicted acyl esterase
MPELHVEVQDNHGAWRIESSYPAPDTTFSQIDLAETTRTGSGQIAPAGGMLGVAGVDDPTLYDAPALASDLRIAGIAYLPLQVTPAGPGGQVFAQLRDVAPDGTSLRLGHAVMDLRYAAGGDQAQPVTPMAPLTARLEFEAMDAVVPAGHHLQIMLQATGEDYLPSSTSSPVQVDGGVLSLPTITLAHGIPFTPPAWSGDAKASPQQP